MDTNQNWSPHNLLPAPEPRTVSPPMDYFYENVAKHLIRDTVRIMNNGLPIDLLKVRELEFKLDEVLADVEQTLANNPHIRAFQQLQHQRLISDYKSVQLSKKKSATDFIKPFKHSDMNHRSYFMHIFAQQQGITEPTDLLPTGVPKWTARDVKKFSATRPLLTKLLDGKLLPKHPIIVQAMNLLAQHKADIYNKKYDDNVANPSVDLPKFNPASSKQKQELFEWLGVESDKTSKTTGLPSYDRDVIEQINKQTADDAIRELTQAMIDHSFGAIVKNNFINAFYQYSVDGRLYGNYKLFGAKSFRFTSNSPNMLNTPSTKSIYSKPIKQCFVAPEGYVIYAIDYSALEDRVIASLTRDTNKCAVFLDGLDGHCLNAYGYFKEEIAQYMTITGDTTTDVREFFQLVESGHKELKAIRQRGKPATFGLSYGSFPAKVAATLKIPIEEAQQIFDRYHNELYSGITDYRENYVLPISASNGKLHLGLGCYIHTDDAGRDIRTVNNASCQFWSILTLLAINRIHQDIDEFGLQDDIQCTSTIYDSIYFIVRDDPEYIKWLNDRIVEYMMVDFMEDQIIRNEATGEIGSSWADLHQIPNNASIEQIQEVLNGIERQ